MNAYSPKKPKSPVCIIATAFTSLARSFNALKRPLISAIHSIRPWPVSKTFVWVFTWYGWARGNGEAAGRVEVEAGREFDCILSS